jgi:hypothetical protein
LGIETRKSRSYYYRKVRRNGRVVSEYMGGGELASLTHRLDLIERDARQNEAAARREAEAEAQAVERDAQALAEEAEQLARLMMLAAGYHQHKRQWRRRRMRPMSDFIEMARKRADRQAGQELARAELQRRKAQAAAPPAELPPLPAPGDLGDDAAKAIVTRCNRPDATAEDVDALRALLAARGARMSAISAPLTKALNAEVDGYSTALAKELTRDHLAQRRRELGYDAAPPLERPLIDHLLLCELRMGTAELRHTALWQQAGLPWKTAAQADRLLSAAQARYLRAVETLARVRRVRVELARVTSPDGTKAEAITVERPGA